MKTYTHRSRFFLIPALLAGLCLMLALPAAARVVDDFNDNTKTAWQDFTFVPGFGLPTEHDGRFDFTLPPAGQSIFTGSVKTTETFTIQDGRTVEMRVDLVTGYGGDSFAVLFFLPQGESIASLTGYGFAKSTTDILITKGINRYFVNEATALKNDNITLVLALTGKGTSVIINAKALDKDANDAVLWERTVVDTAGADILADGTDSPAAPFLRQGNFGLLCYEDDGKTQDYYQVVYDNAEVLVTDATILDDFNDNTKTAWQDFTFVPGFGIPVEQNGQFDFTLPAAGQAIFTGSVKTSKDLEIVDGERLEMRVDVVTGYGGDSFPVLFFLPKGQSIASLTGYGLAKSTTDVLITKGINKYFVNEATALKNDNITLVLSLTGKGTSVIINAKVLDKDANDAVIWERTVVDTAGADILADGTDSPAGAFLGKGNFGLLCYEDDGKTQDYYQAIYDNAVVLAPPVAGNVAPIITEVSPAPGANFLPASGQVSFKASDDKTLPATGLSVILNGTTFTTANGLQVSGSGSTLTATLGGLTANLSYAATLKVVDADGAETTADTHFDTFLPGNLMVEIEDYNFDAGQFIDNEVLAPEGSGIQPNAYNDRVGVLGVDFNETRGTPNGEDTMYRTMDPIRMQRSLDAVRKKYADAGGSNAGVFDYDVGDLVAGEWLNYTRTFPAGSYEVYLREAVVNMDLGESVLELVTGDRTQPDQATRRLGSFLGRRSGFTYRVFPLTDGTGLNKIILRLSGETTLRLHHLTANTSDGGRYLNYLIFVPVADPGIQRASVTSVSPAAGTTVETVTPVVTAAIVNRDTSVNAGTVALTINGAAVAATVTGTPEGATVSYALSPLPAPNSTITARLSFNDNLGVEVATEWSFTLTYKGLDPANRVVGAGSGDGLMVRVVQAPAGTPDLANDLSRAEQQLAPNSSIPIFIETNVVENVINQAQDTRNSGFFVDETLVPGIDENGENGTDDFAVEIQAWLDLPAGIHRFGVVTDDGYKISSGANLSDKEPLLSYHNGGPANETFDFVVTAPGLYPFRMVWYERAGNAYAEWFSVDLATGERVLINDRTNPKAIKAYTAVTAAPQGKLESATVVTGPFTVDQSANINFDTKTITLPVPSANRFYRIQWPMVLGIKIQIASIKVEGQNLVLKYDILPVVP